MTLHVRSPGLHTLVVDFGRLHSRSLGVPIGGAADRTSLALGNALVGNPPNTAALEITLTGPVLQAHCDLACVLYGAPFELSSTRQRLVPGRTFTLHAGEDLHIGGTPTGMRAYFCVQGGLSMPWILGSRSALEPLRAGAELPCLSGTIHSRFTLQKFTTSQEAKSLRVLPGSQATWFGSSTFYAQLFVVTPASNRMGLRLQGEPLHVPERALVSEPVCPGAVQVTRNGQCIILGVDGQTIGGYPKIAHVISADLDRLGQLRPGEQVRFQEITLEEAEALYRSEQARLQQWLLRLRTTELFPPWSHQE